MEDFKSCRLGISIVAVGQYGKDVLSDYKNNLKTKLEPEYFIEVYTEKDIEIIEKSDSSFFIVIGDMQDKNSKIIIDKLIKKDAKKYFLIKDMADITAPKVGIINVLKKQDALNALEVLTYAFIKPGIICIDEADIWNLTKYGNFSTKNIKGTLEDVKDNIANFDELTNAKAVLINIISKNTGLHEINIIAESVQEKCSKDVAIIFYYTDAEKAHEKEFELNLLYSI